MKTANKRVIVVDIIEEIESTNNFLKENCSTLPERYTLRAVNQIAGRGRLGRVWSSKKGDDLTFSTLVPVSPELQAHLLNIPQVTALALKEVLGSYGIHSEIKWPNDILVDGKKIAGILVEGIFQGGSQYLIVGIGLNVNSTDHTMLDIDAVSMRSTSGNSYDINEILDKLVHRLYDLIEQLEREGFRPFRESADSALAFRDEQRTLFINGEECSAKIRGIDDDGALIIEKKDGETVSIISGEISFRNQA